MEENTGLTCSNTRHVYLSKLECSEQHKRLTSGNVDGVFISSESATKYRGLPEIEEYLSTKPPRDFRGDLLFLHLLLWTRRRKLQNNHDIFP